MMRAALSVLLFCLAAAWPQCTSFNHEDLDRRIVQSTREAAALFKEGKNAEAMYMLSLADDLYPADEAIIRLKNQLTLKQKHEIESLKLLGHNLARRKIRTDTPLDEKIVYYIPDRLNDLLDTFSMSFIVGSFSLRGQATRYAGASATAENSISIGYCQKFKLCFESERSLELQASKAGLTAITATRHGTGGEDVNKTRDLTLTHSPEGKIYQEYRDFYAIGGELTLLTGFSFEVHPLEIADFFAGFFGVDFLNDSLATSRNLEYSREQKKLLASLDKDYLDIPVDEHLQKYPRIVYDRPQQAAAKVKLVVRNQKARVLILPFSNKTGSGNYSYLSSSLEYGVSTYMHETFDFDELKLDLPARKKLARQAESLVKSSTAEVGTASTDTTDYIIGGTYSLNRRRNQMQVTTYIYDRPTRRRLHLQTVNINLDQSLFNTLKSTSLDLVETIKKL